MPELLNLDSLTSVTREVTIGGAVYSLKEPSVSQMIANINQAAAVEEASEGGFLADSMTMVKTMTASCQQILPDCPIEKIEALTMRQMNALMDFASQKDEELTKGESTENTETDIKPGK